MLTSKQNSSQRIRTLINQNPIFNSVQNSLFIKLPLSDDNSKQDVILNTQRSIIKQNLNKLKNLLSQNKQFTKKNRADISPEKIYHDSSISKFKYCTPNNQRSQKSKIYLNSHQRSRDSLSPRKVGNQSLIIDIKRKIKGSPSPSRFQNYLDQGYFIKGIVKPQTVSLYADDLVNSNKQVNLLIRENQKYQSKIQDQNALIDQLNKKIQELQNKLQNIVTFSQQNQEKYHSIMFEKEEQIRNQLSQKEQLQLQVKSSIEHFFNFYLEKLTYLTKKVNIKVTNVEKRLQNIHLKQLKKMHKKVQLQKFIFESQKPYRKSKNLLQKSPSVKGDNFSELQQKRHQIQIEMFERQVQYEKNKYQKTIQSYKQNYDDLYGKFVQAQKKNETLKSQIMKMKQQQQNFLKLYEQNQRKLEQEKKNNEIQHIYFKKQLAQLKIQQDFFTENKQNLTVKSMLNTPKSLTKSRHSPKSLYLKLNQDVSGKSDIQKKSIKQTQKIQEIIKQKQKILLEKQTELQLKQKQLQQRQKQFQQHIKIKQQYFDELNHIKNILKTVQESKIQQEGSKSDKNKVQQAVRTQRQNRSSKSPLKLKQLSKVEYLAKKQKKEKEVVQSKLQTLQRQLQYQKIKNNQLQSLIEEKENKLFHQIKEIVYTIENQPSSQQMQQSMIHEEQPPIDSMQESYTKSKINKIQHNNNDYVTNCQSKVKDRLENAIERLQALEELSSSRSNRKVEHIIQQ